jgi:hypothetical protein
MFLSKTQVDCTIFQLYCTFSGHIAGSCLAMQATLLSGELLLPAGCPT